MLDNLLLAFQLSTQPNLPSLEHYALQNQTKKPAVYAQASEESSINILLKKAEEQALKNPKYAAELYINIIKSDNPLREKAVGNALATYKKLLEKSNSKPLLEGAMKIYDEVINQYENSFGRNINSSDAAKAYLFSGMLVCCRVENKNLEEGTKRLSIALNVGSDIDTKVHALNTLGYMEWEKGNSDKAKEYFQEADSLTSGKHTQIHKKVLKDIESSKTK